MRKDVTPKSKYLRYSLVVLLFGLATSVLPSLIRGQNARPKTLYPFVKHKKWGYIDKTGKVVIKPQFIAAEGFSDGIGLVWTDYKTRACLDNTGKIVSAFPMGFSCAFSEGFVAINEGDKHQFINKNGKVNTRPEFEWVGNFSEGLAAVKINGKYGYINKQLEIVIGPHLDEASDFSKGLAPVRLRARNRDAMLFNNCFDHTTDYGYIDRTGNVVIPAQFNDAGEFSDGLAAVRICDGDIEKWGFIDRTGALVIPAIFDEAWGFEEGLAPVKIGSKWGYIDRNGKIIIQPIYESAHNFSDGIAMVEVGRTYYTSPHKHYSVVQIHLDGYWGYIDKTGKFIWKTKGK